MWLMQESASYRLVLHQPQQESSCVGYFGLILTLLCLIIIPYFVTELSDAVIIYSQQAPSLSVELFNDVEFRDTAIARVGTPTTLIAIFG
ncbi:hypothetical protein V9T40_012923 [Parthenolecanium corni]|uniref:Uncharacterized protein n=1 Tax=Parthenolecanium corni TaxID=536013 RepID=A0AAN9T867_9HEMI